MIRFSTDPVVAEKQMQAVIFYVTTFGHIDGDFDLSEREFVRLYIRRLVEHRVDSAGVGEDALRAELVDKYTKHFHEVFEGIDRHVKELFTEAVASDEDQDAFVHAKLKLRCFEIFQSFDRETQEQLMEAIDDLIDADGQAHPAEVKFRAELAQLLEADLDIEMIDETPHPPVHVETPVELHPSLETHPFFDQFEFHYSRDPDKLQRQASADMALIDRTIAVIDAQRQKGRGKLAGKHSIAELANEEPFLDDFVHVLPPKPGREYELTVLGDLHGCYSCLKAAILQSRFFEKVKAFREDPAANPEPKLVLLGDYIDRGMFSFNGVLRSVMQLQTTAPEHVYALRGNHEYYLEYQGNVYGGVKPAEAINTLKPHLPVDVFKHYMKLFDALPSMFLFGGVLFVHAGIPRDRALKERFKDLSSLNDPELRFQMLWSDPSSADVVPADLQDQSSRFAFGRLQCHAFLQRIGAHTIVRGHEKENEGFKRVYDDGQILLITLFSAGGATNDDLPADSSYRTVTPMAMTLRYGADGSTQIVPWAIEYETYNDPERNAFFKSPPEIAHRVE